MLSQLARVTDTSQLRIEIQNVARVRAHTHTPRSAPDTSAPLPRAHIATRSPRDIRRDFQERNAMLCEATEMDSLQRNWIAQERFLTVVGSF